MIMMVISVAVVKLDFVSEKAEEAQSLAKGNDEEFHLNPGAVIVFSMTPICFHFCF